MKKINILVIFLFACLSVFLIYKKYYKKENKILILGDNNLIEITNYNYLNNLKKNYKNINTDFISNYKKYYDIENDIKNNLYIYNKGSKIYLNQEISNSNIIIISANNFNYAFRCGKNNRIIDEYNNENYIYLNNLINTIKRISDAKVIIMGNYCTHYNEYISDRLNKMYANMNYINMYELYNSYKNDDYEYYIYRKIEEFINQK